MMLTDHLVLALLWILFGLLHSVLASLRIKQGLRRLLGSRYRYYRILYTLFAFLTLGGLLAFQVSLSSPLLFVHYDAVAITGGLFAVGGLLLMGVCIRKYFVSLSGLRSLFYEGHSNQLIISGVHRYVRHPLYLGTFAFVWGLFLLLPYASLLVACIMITAYTLYGIRLEEYKLVGEFGEAYRQYQRQVPQLLPFSKPKRNAAA